ncbi:hypothetical protein GCM10027047_08290 [Rhodococcus aerolatus]
MTAPEVPAATTCAGCGRVLDGRDRFCEHCGRVQGVEQGGTGAARAAFGAPTDRPCPRCGTEPTDDDRADEFTAEHCGQCGARRPDGTDRVEVDLGVVALVSDRGLVHTRNEDAGEVAVLRDLGGDGDEAATGPGVAVAVCDGVSSVRRPELASAAAGPAALDALVAALVAGADLRRGLLDAGAAAARAVAEVGRELQPDPPACTVVTAALRPGPGGVEVVVGSVGDSRAYWLDDRGGSRVLTEDDSWAAEVVRAGLADAETAMADRRAHSITRWVGADTADDPAMVGPRIARLVAPGPGLLLVCTDGLWNYLPGAADLAAVVTGLDPAAAADALTTLALERGGHDNVTVAVVAVG